MRGYGRTDCPEEVDKFTLLHLVGDMVGLLDALGADSAVIVGHDWGAAVAWHAALMRPDRFRAVVGLSVPFRPRGPVSPIKVMPQNDHELFYQLYFQSPGVAETELERDVRATMQSLLFFGSGDAPTGGQGQRIDMVPRQGGFLSRMPGLPPVPSWLSEGDIDFYTGEFTRTGFRGGLSWYRNIDRNWELLAPFTGARVTVPALYVAGDRDLVVSFVGMDKAIANMAKSVPDLRGTIMLPGCGHWTQQERPREVNAALLEFLRALS
jgi:pimeloyl-ACP methyl ester carboxylesterase